ncbi:hypothetical protein AS850_09935 [Frondihabitans sp. 762G35]|uniref:Rv3235 family protein n=1 Tax=Frondihabitans sp. 762G35 TaxID=1446794 RepID=UPI000D2157E1|nr:Rv3235 family protein [Frondihabitans sp. 762G35]ARC57394.1 hypothetical protein AS850_09935 [Frondihabitans sp. 762G35]
MSTSSAAPRRTPLPSEQEPPAPRATALEPARGATLHALPGVAAPPGADAFFDAQPTPRSGLPDPAPLVTNLARCVVEILVGAREIEQLARWVTDDVYRHLVKRVVLATRARAARGTSAVRPSFSVGTVVISEPADGVVEAVVVMHGRVRSRAVAIRLEGLDRRWRATAINVL